MTLDRLLQLLVNGVMTGAIIALPAVAFSIIFAVVRISNFSLAAHMTAGAFVGYVANVVLGVPLLPAVAIAFVVTGAIGIATDWIALKPLRATGGFTVVIASLALNIMMENIVRFFFGNDPRGLNVPTVRDWRFGGIRVDPQQVENMAVAVVAVILLFALLHFTMLGKAMRAAADNPRLADVKGVDPEAMSRLASFLGMGLAGIAGLLIGHATAIDPLLGFRVILPVFAAAVLGGLGSLHGAVLGGVLIGVAEELATLVLPPAYKSGVGFAIILAVLVFMPSGLFGRAR